MSSFMDLRYESDSDSANDLDFEPAANSNSSGSDSDRDDANTARDRNDPMSDVDLNEDNEALESHATALSTVENTTKTSFGGPVDPSSMDSASSIKENAPTALDTASASAVEVHTAAVIKDSPLPTKAKASKKKPVAASTSTDAIEATGPKDNSAATVNDNAIALEIVVKKKKGPKPGTKYKKRTPSGEKATGKGKRAAVPGQDTASKRGKTSKKAQEAVSEAALQSSIRQTTAGLNGFPLDLEHPLESFKWPYSPFTSEFRNQHALRNNMAQDTSLRLEELRKSNSVASHQLQQLDYQLQSNRQNLKISLDEIQFRRSQLRDMSVMAVDIVRRLCLPRISDQRSSEHLDNGQRTFAVPTRNLITPLPISTNHTDGARPSSVGPRIGGDSWEGEYKPSSQISMDQVEINGDPRLQRQPPPHQGQPSQHVHQEHLSILKGLNESNIRTFLEKMRELDQASIRSINVDSR